MQQPLNMTTVEKAIKSLKTKNIVKVLTTVVHIQTCISTIKENVRNVKTYNSRFMRKQKPDNNVGQLQVNGKLILTRETKLRT